MPGDSSKAPGAFRRADDIGQADAELVIDQNDFPARDQETVDQHVHRLAREAVHAVGHLWDLHHCYDPKCAMHPSWSPALPPNPEMTLCNFCREKSERKIRLAKT